MWLCAHGWIHRTAKRNCRISKSMRLSRAAYGIDRIDSLIAHRSVPHTPCRRRVHLTPFVLGRQTQFRITHSMECSTWIPIRAFLIFRRRADFFFSSPRLTTWNTQTSSECDESRRQCQIHWSALHCAVTQMCIECVQLCIYNFFVNSFSTPSSFIHKWFREEQKIHRTSRSIVSNLVCIAYSTYLYRLYSLYFLSFKTTLKFNHTWDFSHYRRSHTHTHDKPHMEECKRWRRITDQIDTN